MYSIYVIIICRVRYETYILYCTRAPIRRVDYTRVLKTTESGIGRKDGNLLSFFFPLIFPAA